MSIKGIGYILISADYRDAPIICRHCNDAGEIETDNNGPIVPCPACSDADTPKATEGA